MLQEMELWDSFIVVHIGKIMPHIAHVAILNFVEFHLSVYHVRND